VTPARLAAREIEGREVAIAIVRDEQPREARGHDRVRGRRAPRSRLARARPDERAVTEVEQIDSSVGAQAREPAWRRERGRTNGWDFPVRLPARAVEARDLVGAGENQTIAAEEGRAQIDAGHARRPPRLVAEHA